MLICKSTAYAKYLEYKAKAESEKASAYAAATKAFEEKKRNLKTLSIKHTKNGGNQHEW